MTALIHALRDPRCYPHPSAGVRLIETHISWLFLTGEYVYKIKKPVDLGFVDFSTLERRRHFCAEELRLNRRFAPGIYLDVVPITGSAEHPRIGGDGAAVEYAVRMREFAQSDLLDARLRDGRLDAAQIDALADAIASFHEHAAIAPAESPHGAAASLLADALANFDAIAARGGGDAVCTRLDALRHWTLAEHRRLAADFDRRQAQGRIRECHGDLHLGNIALIDGRITPFDCIEFNAAFRWIDVMNELAFTAMDLAARGRCDFAHRLVNRYLEANGNYAGLAVLRFYLVYRAMVRAKVDCIHAGQRDVSAEVKEREQRDFLARIEIAERYAKPCEPFLAITTGLSGSGKTHVSQIAVERTGAIRLRSDVERKRLFGLAPHQASASSLHEGIYHESASDRTFDRLAELARQVLAAGHSVIVDATFLLHARRQPFVELAAAMNVPFVILSCQADDAVLERRIALRQAARSDASEADIDVMRGQKAFAQALDASEQRAAIVIDAGDDASLTRAIDRLAALGGTPP